MAKIIYCEISFHCFILTSTYRYIYVTCTSRALQSHDLLGEGISCRSYTYSILTTQGHGGHPQMRDQLNAGAISKITRTLQRIQVIHSHKADKRRIIMMSK